MEDDFNFGLVAFVLPLVVLYIWSIIEEKRGGKR